MADVLADKYRSLFVIGRGGMGAVEAAVESGQHRVVALKRLLPDAAKDARRSEMFLREAKVAALLEHPNVVRAFDYGEVDGELYLAMEYVEGQSLAVVLRALDAPLPSPVIAYLLAEVCEGLHAAHELNGEDGTSLGLVHRDVSPQNIMIGYDGRVRLLDFGVAKIEAESVTKTGEVKGKTAYMSPEQAMGDAIDRRSDLFGLGAVLYECCTLKRMWGQGTDMEVIRKLALEEPPDLEKAPEAMRALYKQLVNRDVKERPSTALDVAKSLRSMAAPDGAAQLGELLTRQFGDQLAAQRKQLEAALDDVSPSLRQSVMPKTSTPPMSRMTTVPAPAPKRPWGIVVAAVIAVSVLAWLALRTPAVAETPRSVETAWPEPQKTEPSAIVPKPVVDNAPTLAPPEPIDTVFPGHMRTAPTESARPRVVQLSPPPVTSKPVASATAKVVVPAPPASTPGKVDEKPF